MARRKDHTREELYALAIGAAERIVEADGFRALTARNVADVIGYSPGTLYNLFENLDDIILHLNARTFDRLYGELSQISVSGIARDDLERLLDAYLDFLARHPNLWRAVTDFSLTNGRTVPEWYARKVDKMLGLIERALAPVFADGARQTAGAHARVLWASLHGICSLAQADKLDVLNMDSVRTMAEIMVHTFVAGIEAERKGGAS